MGAVLRRSLWFPVARVDGSPRSHADGFKDKALKAFAATAVDQRTRHVIERLADEKERAGASHVPSQSSLMLPVFTTLSHRADSDLMSLVNSSGVLPISSTPLASNRFLVSGVFMAFTVLV